MSAPSVSLSLRRARWASVVEPATRLFRGRAGRMMRFVAVGGSGVIVNIAVMAIAMSWGMHFLPAGVLGTEVSVVTNFLLHERFVFRDRKNSRRWHTRFLTVVVYNNVEFVVRAPILVAVVAAGLNGVIAQFLTLVVAFVARFAFTSRVVYRHRPSDASADSAPTVPGGAAVVGS